MKQRKQLTIRLSNVSLERIEQYRLRNGLCSVSRAIEDIIAAYSSAGCPVWHRDFIALVDFHREHFEKGLTQEKRKVLLALDELRSFEGK